MVNEDTERVLARDSAETATAAGGAGGEAIDEVAALRAEAEQAREEAAQFRNKYLRAAADMENYRKSVDRTALERDRAFRRSVLARFLPIVDNLTRALDAAERGQATLDALTEGVRLTQKGMLDVLAAEGVQPIETAGATFDPHYHEAVGTAPAGPETPPGTIVAETERGYTLDGMVLRPARVIVAE